MKKLTLATALFLLPSVAFATQSSMLCKTDKNEFIDIVATDKSPTDVLVQINGGPFYNGAAAYSDENLLVTVQFTTGIFLLNYSAKTNSGVSMLTLNGQKVASTIQCTFR